MHDPAIQSVSPAGLIGRGLPRFLEMVVALIGLFVVAPLLVVLMIITRLTSQGPAVFSQKRVGRDGRLFVLYKLRTMRANVAGPKVTSGDDPRITRFGKILRKSKLDELPQLWNVVNGDMSLVGPRPEVPEYVDPVNPSWRTVLQVRPGLTDPVTLEFRDEEMLLAEVKGDRESFYLQKLQPVKLQGYLAYLARRSWLTDVRVIGRTVAAIFGALLANGAKHNREA